jgi:transposase-like protein
MTTLLAIIFFLIAQISIKQDPSPEKYACKTVLKPACPRCGSHHSIKNGSTHHGKPKRQCKNCGRQFVVEPSQEEISLEIKQLIDQLLLKRICLRGIARVTGVSWS